MEKHSDISLQLDAKTARLVLDAMYAMGEHQAAGAAIPALNSEESELLGQFIKELHAALGGKGRLV